MEKDSCFYHREFPLLEHQVDCQHLAQNYTIYTIVVTASTPTISYTHIINSTTSNQYNANSGHCVENKARMVR